MTGRRPDIEDTQPLHVLVVDDSAVVRQGMAGILTRDPKISVTVAADPLIAMSRMQRARPDVIVLDLEMPRMDGLSFLRKLMAEDPIPVVVCSAVTGHGTQAAIRALEEGAVDVVTKPRLGVREFLEESALTLIETVRGAARARVKRLPKPVTVEPRFSADAVIPARRRHASHVGTDVVVAVGASTGGTEALKVLLEAMPKDCPGLVIVQHMPAGFTRAFADRLDQLCGIRVKEAASGDRVAPGQALVAPGDRHTLVTRIGSEYSVVVKDGPLVSRHRPSVDVLFRSVALAAGPNAVGVIMTGMGDDGAAGLLEMKQAGATTLAQDKNSCVVFGMPKEAIARAAVDDIAPLDRLAAAVLRRAAR